MFSILWGDIQQGQLARLPYLGYSLLVSLLLILIGVSAVLLENGVERGANGIESISLTLSLPGFVLLLLMTIPLGLSGLNLMAKRLRHIGLPGWPTTITLTLLVLAIAYGWSLPGAHGFQFLIWMTLLLLPKNTFSHSPNSSVH